MSSPDTPLSVVRGGGVAATQEHEPFVFENDNNSSIAMSSANINLNPRSLPSEDFRDELFPVVSTPLGSGGGERPAAATAAVVSADQSPRALASSITSLPRMSHNNDTAAARRRFRGRGGGGANTNGHHHQHPLPPPIQILPSVNEEDDVLDGDSSDTISEYHYDEDGKPVTTRRAPENDAERVSRSYMRMAHSFARTPLTSDNTSPTFFGRTPLSSIPNVSSTRNAPPAIGGGGSQRHHREMDSILTSPQSSPLVPPNNAPQFNSNGSTTTTNSGAIRVTEERVRALNGASIGGASPPGVLGTDLESVITTGTTVGTSSFSQQPRHIRRLAKAIKKLNKEELIHISGMASLKAYRDVFSIRQYSGEAWYLPKTRKVKEDEARWRLIWTLTKGLQITAAGREVSIRVISITVRIALLVIMWVAAWCALDPHQYLIEPGGYIFDALVAVIVSTLIGGVVGRVLGIPPLVGVLWAAIMWRNIPLNPSAGSGDPEYMTDGIIPIERTIIARAGLTLILLRAGYSLNVAALRPILPNALALGTLPMAIEGIVTSFVAEAVFHYGDWSWAFLHGFVCSIISAAIVVPGILVLQSDGYSKARGPIPQMLSSIGLETVLGVWSVTFMVGLMFDSTPIGLAIALGPIQIIAGVIIGILAGILFHLTIATVRKEATKLPTGKYSDEFNRNMNRLIIVSFLSIGFAFVYAGNRLSLAGGGAVSTMMFSATVSHLWTGKSAFFDHQKKLLGAGLADFWDLFMMPILLTSTGSTIELSRIFNKDFLPKGLACWAAGTATRIAVTASTGLGTGLDWKEFLFLGVSWVGRAGVQSTMGSVALTRAKEALALTVSGTTEFTAAVRDVERATILQSNAILYILIFAPLGAIWVTKAGPILLKKDHKS